MLAECLEGIFRATGFEAASTAGSEHVEYRGTQELIDAYQEDQQATQDPAQGGEDFPKNGHYS